MKVGLGGSSLSRTRPANFGVAMLLVFVNVFRPPGPPKSCVPIGDSKKKRLGTRDLAAEPRF